MGKKYQIKTIRKQVNKGKGIIINNCLYEIAELLFRNRFKVAFALVFKKSIQLEKILQSLAK